MAELDSLESEFFGKLSPGQGSKEFVVKRKRFSIEQIVAVLKQAELGMPVADLIRQVGISEQTFYRWKKQYAGMQSDQARSARARSAAWLLIGDEGRKPSLSTRRRQLMPRRPPLRGTAADQTPETLPSFRVFARDPYRPA